MKAKLYGVNGKEKKGIELPKVFNTGFKPTVIKKAVLVAISHLRQKYGANSKAGNRSSAHYHGRRDDRYTMMNREMARVQRIHSGGYLHMAARNVPQSTKGRKAHPSKPGKKFSLKINKKEKKLAVKSALASTTDMDKIKARGHKFEDSPIIVGSGIEKEKKTKNVYNFMITVGMEKELKRCKQKKVRSGKGTRRGRKYKTKKGPLFIVSKKCNLTKAARNIPGVDVRTARNVNVLDLAPGGIAGRLCVITKNALEKIEKRFGG